jgi:hypothetical protein
VRPLALICLLPLLLASVLAGETALAAPMPPRWLRARDSLPILLGAGALWALGLTGLAVLLDRSDAGAWAGWLLAVWLLVLPGLLGLYFGRWWWLLPVAAGLGAFAWIAPAGLESRLGNLTIFAIIFAVAPVTSLTGLGAAFRPRPRAASESAPAASDDAASDDIEVAPGE